MILGIVSTVTALAWGILQLDALREWRIYAEYIAILMAVWGVVWAICIVARFKRTGESKQLTGPQP
jgi:hypothetical protein